MCKGKKIIKVMDESAELTIEQSRKLFDYITKFQEEFRAKTALNRIGNWISIKTKEEQDA